MLLVVDRIFVVGDVAGHLVCRPGSTETSTGDGWPFEVMLGDLSRSKSTSPPTRAHSTDATSHHTLTPAQAPYPAYSPPPPPPFDKNRKTHSSGATSNPNSASSSPNINIPLSVLPICVVISYNNAFRPHLSTGLVRICCTGRTIGSDPPAATLPIDADPDGIRFCTIWVFVLAMGECLAQSPPLPTRVWVCWPTWDAPEMPDTDPAPAPAPAPGAWPLPVADKGWEEAPLGMLTGDVGCCDRM